MGVSLGDKTSDASNPQEQNIHGDSFSNNGMSYNYANAMPHTVTDLNFDVMGSPWVGHIIDCTVINRTLSPAELKKHTRYPTNKKI